MALFLVLDDFAGETRFSAGELVDDESFDVAELARAGVALIPYVDVTMEGALEAFRQLPASRAPRGELLSLLVAAGAIGGGAGSGDVIGPASSTADAIVRFAGITGKVVKNSAVTITDAGSIVLPALQTVDGRDVSVDGAKLDTITPGAQPQAVSSVHARTGAVVGALGDYTPALLPVPATGSPVDVTQLEQAYRRIWSAGSVSGFDLTDNGDGTITVAAGEGMLRVANTDDAELRSVACPGGSPALVDGAVNYVFFEWNAGAPQIDVTTSITGFSCRDACLLYTIARAGVDLAILDGRSMNVDANRKLRRLLFETERLIHVTGGTALGASGRALTVTAGAFYYALSRQDHGAFDTSIAGSALPNVFALYYRDGVGGWTRVAGEKLVNNQQFDNGSGTLATMTANRYRTDHVYVIPGNGGRLAVVLGTNNGTIAQARAALAPTQLPPLLAAAGVLIGRVIIQRDATTIAEVDSAFAVVIPTAPATNHNQLSSLQGGSTSERFHVSALEAADLTAIHAVGADRLVYRDLLGDIVGLDPASLGGGLPYVSGFSAGATAADQDFYVAATDLLNVATFTMVAMVRPRSPLSHQTIIGSGSELGGDGHSLILETEILRGYALDSTGDSVATLAFLGERTFGRWMFVALKKVTFGADWINQLIINGSMVSQEYRVSGGGARASHVLAVGASFNGLGRAAGHLEISFCGLAFRDVLNAELAEWFSQIVDGPGFVNAPGGLDHAWLAEDAGGATWDDAIGAADLVRTGTAGTISTGTRALRI